MSPALDVGLAILPFPIADGQVKDFQIQPGRPKEQIKVTKGVKVPEIGPIGLDLVILQLPQGLGAA